MKLSWDYHHVRLSTATACPALTVRPLHCTALPTGRRLIVRINFTPVAVPMMFSSVASERPSHTPLLQGLRALFAQRRWRIVPKQHVLTQIPPMDACIQPRELGNTLISSQLWAEIVKSTNQRVAPNQEAMSCAIEISNPVSFSSALRNVRKCPLQCRMVASTLPWL